MINRKLPGVNKISVDDRFIFDRFTAEMIFVNSKESDQPLIERLKLHLTPNQSLNLRFDVIDAIIQLFESI